jgi:hypothetical protein
MAHRDGMEPGRSAELSTRIEQAFRDDPSAILSPPVFADATDLPLSQVSYSFLRLAEEKKIEEMATVPRGPTIERLYRASA